MVRFNLDLLLSHVSVPYVPTVGIVDRGCIEKGIFIQVINAANNHEFLPFDKDKRWFDVKYEHIVPEVFYQTGSATYILTYSSRTAKAQVIHYSKEAQADKSVAIDLAKKLGKQCDAELVSFYSSNENAKVSHAFKQAFDTSFKKAEDIFFYEDLEDKVASSLEKLGQEPINAGFVFLAKKIQTGLRKPILCAVVKDEIVGAIGPLEVGRDYLNRKMTMPQYFGIRSSERGTGIGKKLWLSMCAWSKDHSSEYMLLQADEQAAGFYQRLGLEKIGNIYRQTLEISK